MLQALKYLDARLMEASTWASVAGILAGLGATLPPGMTQQVAFWGVLVAGLLGVLLREKSGTPPQQVALDVLAQVGQSIKAANDAEAMVAANDAGALSAARPGAPVIQAPQPPVVQAQTYSPDDSHIGVKVP